MIAFAGCDSRFFCLEKVFLPIHTAGYNTAKGGASRVKVGLQTSPRLLCVGTL
jgi:hypothetical protein